jgi:hypothetical protein
MNLQHRINLLSRLGNFIKENNSEWQETVEKAQRENAWFIPEFINHATSSIANNFLEPGILRKWAAAYGLEENRESLQTVGIVMAGNIPLAGFHDLMSVFISGNRAMMKTSSRDDALIRALVNKLIEWEPEVAGRASFSEMLRGCDAYIATGSNNSSRYFEFYFNRFPHIIRRNRTSVAILEGKETNEELDRLADDVFLYFGLGCRNVTKLYVPPGYDWLPLLAAFKKYSYLADHHKFRNNYDYNLALHLLNKVYYMSNGSLLLVEDKSVFSPVSQLNYEYFRKSDPVRESLRTDPSVQCIVSQQDIPFGMAQNPAITDYADGVDTLRFLSKLTNR